MRANFLKISLIVFFISQGLFLTAQISDKYYENWNSPEVQQRIAE